MNFETGAWPYVANSSCFPSTDLLNDFVRRASSSIFRIEPGAEHPRILIGHRIIDEHERTIASLSVVSAGHGIAPQLYLDSARHEAIVACDNELLVIDLATATERLRLNAGSLVYRVVFCNDMDRRVIILELGAIVFDGNWRIVRRYDAAEIVSRWRRVGQRMELVMSEGALSQVDLR